MNTRAWSTIHTLSRVSLLIALVGVLLLLGHLSAQALGPDLRGIRVHQQATLTPAPTPRPVSTDVVIPRGRTFFYGRLVRAGWIWIGAAGVGAAVIAVAVVARRRARR